MTSDVNSWLSGSGADFLVRVGLRAGDRVLDYGCGSGHYAIPASRAVGRDGLVVALDKDRQALLRLRKEAGSRGLANIRLEAAPEEPAINFPEQTFDAILAYDVLHYFERRQRLLAEFHRVLKEAGFLSVYPKHHRDDYPLSNLAHRSLGEIISEIEEAGFSLKERFRQELIHDDNYNRGTILNFIKKEARKDE